jgi:hypothetical protein
MFTTSILNLYFILRRSLHNSIDTSKDDVTHTIANESVPLQQYLEKNNDPFEQTYQTFLHSFVRSYVSILNDYHDSNYCPAIPPHLQGPMSIDLVPSDFSIRINSSYHPYVNWGGWYRPQHCLARHKIALIVPYRERWKILEQFLFHTHKILQRQQLDYRIFVCEQAFNKTFNKGIVMNGCFKEILKLEPNTRCFVMHDVDLLLIDDRNMYTCPIYPRHLSVSIDKFQFYLPYNELVGGVLGK